MRKPVKTKFYSKRLGNLAKGCELCVKGEKLVLYITGLCPRRCWYCPLSERRKNKDVVFINEWESSSLNDLKREVELCQSKGAGITGGDPLSKLDRTITYIKFMKENFGEGFHIHLYTSFDLVTKENLSLLYNAGLDEIRFHADLDTRNENISGQFETSSNSDDKLWGKVDIANEFKWDVGVEIPAIPDKLSQIKKVCDFFDKKISFLNLNEFEISDLNSDEMYSHGFDTKSDISHGISGSEEMSDEILEYCLNKSFNVHFCTGTLKDKVQMQNRFKLRAESVKTKFDVVSDEGLLIRGVIYLKGFTNADFKKGDFDEDEILNRLQEKKEFLQDEGLEVLIDTGKLRLISYPEHVEQFADVLKEHGMVPAIVEEDPSVEQFETSVELL